MNLDEIKTAVRAGKTVHWKQRNYVVEVDRLDQWFIVCTSNRNAIGLTWRDGVTMNGEPEDFYIG